MNKLTLTLALVIFCALASARNVAAQCGDCASPALGTDGYCTALTTYMDCLKDAKTDNAVSSTCTDSIKENLITVAEAAKTAAKCGVSGLVSSATMSLVLASLSFFLTKFK